MALLSDILRDGCTWDSGYVALLFGRRKPSCPKKRFLTELFRYTDMRFSAFGKGLKGYIVLATEDFEMAYLNWSSKKHFDRVTSSKKISALLDLPINHIELWKEARKYPTWLQRGASVINRDVDVTVEEIFPISSIQKVLLRESRSRWRLLWNRVSFH